MNAAITALPGRRGREREREKRCHLEGNSIGYCLTEVEEVEVCPLLGRLGPQCSLASLLKALRTRLGGFPSSHPSLSEEPLGASHTMFHFRGRGFLFFSQNALLLEAGRGWGFGFQFVMDGWTHPTPPFSSPPCISGQPPTERCARMPIPAAPLQRPFPSQGPSGPSLTRVFVMRWSLI